MRRFPPGGPRPLGPVPESRARPCLGFQAACSPRDGRARRRRQRRAALPAGLGLPSDLGQEKFTARCITQSINSLRLFHLQVRHGTNSAVPDPPGPGRCIFRAMNLVTGPTIAARPGLPRSTVSGPQILVNALMSQQTAGGGPGDGGPAGSGGSPRRGPHHSPLRPVPQIRCGPDSKVGPRNRFEAISRRSTQLSHEYSALPMASADALVVGITPGLDVVPHIGDGDLGLGIVLARGDGLGVAFTGVISRRPTSSMMR